QHAGTLDRRWAGAAAKCPRHARRSRPLAAAARKRSPRFHAARPHGPAHAPGRARADSRVAHAFTGGWSGAPKRRVPPVAPSITRGVAGPAVVGLARRTLRVNRIAGRACVPPYAATDDAIPVVGLAASRLCPTLRSRSSVPDMHQLQPAAVGQPYL